MLNVVLRARGKHRASHPLSETRVILVPKKLSGTDWQRKHAASKGDCKSVDMGICYSLATEHKRIQYSMSMEAQRSGLRLGSFAEVITLVGMAH